MPVRCELKIKITVVPVINPHPEERAVVFTNQLRGFNSPPMAIFIHPIQDTAGQIANAQILNTIPIAVTILTAILMAVIPTFIMPLRAV